MIKVIELLDEDEFPNPGDPHEYTVTQTQLESNDKFLLYACCCYLGNYSFQFDISASNRLPITKQPQKQQAIVFLNEYRYKEIDQHYHESQCKALFSYLQNEDSLFIMRFRKREQQKQYAIYFDKTNSITPKICNFWSWAINLQELIDCIPELSHKLQGLPYETCAQLSTLLQAVDTNCERETLQEKLLWAVKSVHTYSVSKEVDAEHKWLYLSPRPEVPSWCATQESVEEAVGELLEKIFRFLGSIKHRDKRNIWNQYSQNLYWRDLAQLLKQTDSLKIFPEYILYRQDKQWLFDQQNVIPLSSIDLDNFTQQQSLLNNFINTHPRVMIFNQQVWSLPFITDKLTRLVELRRERENKQLDLEESKEGVDENIQSTMVDYIAEIELNENNFRAFLQVFDSLKLIENNYYELLLAKGIRLSNMLKNTEVKKIYMFFEHPFELVYLQSVLISFEISLPSLLHVIDSYQGQSRKKIEISGIQVFMVRKEQPNDLKNFINLLNISHELSRHVVIMQHHFQQFYSLADNLSNLTNLIVFDQNLGFTGPQLHQIQHLKTIKGRTSSLDLLKLITQIAKLNIRNYGYEGKLLDFITCYNIDKSFSQSRSNFSIPSSEGVLSKKYTYYCTSRNLNSEYVYLTYHDVMYALQHEDKRYFLSEIDIRKDFSSLQINMGIIEAHKQMAVMNGDDFFYFSLRFKDTKILQWKDIQKGKPNDHYKLLYLDYMLRRKFYSVNIINSIPIDWYAFEKHYDIIVESGDLKKFVETLQVGNGQLEKYRAGKNYGIFAKASIFRKVILSMLRLLPTGKSKAYKEKQGRKII